MITTTTTFNPFVVLMIGRSGSTLLTELLTTHPRVRATGEKLSRMPKAERQLSWTARFLTTAEAPSEQAVGFKVKFKDLVDPDAFRELIVELGARVIVLRRRNIVKLTLSWLNSQRVFERTGRWNLDGDDRRLTRLEVDPARFDHRLGQMEASIERLERYAATLGLPALYLYYEDLLYERETTMERVFDFLGVEYAPTEESCVKATPDDLREAVANFDALRSAYVGTRYLDMFDERAT